MIHGTICRFGQIFSVCCNSILNWYCTSLEYLRQVAERQGKFLEELLNRIGKAGGGYANGAKDMEFGEPFVYKHMGSMASIGRYKALVDLRQSRVRFRILQSNFSLFFQLSLTIKSGAY